MVSVLSHQYNLISLGQTCPSSIAFKQQFTLFLCFHLPAPLMLLDPFLNIPAQKLAMFSKKSKHCWEATSLQPPSFSSVFQPPLLMLISLLLFFLLKESLLLRKTIKHGA